MYKGFFLKKKMRGLFLFLCTCTSTCMKEQTGVDLSCLLNCLPPYFLRLSLTEGFKTDFGRGVTFFCLLCSGPKGFKTDFGQQPGMITSRLTGLRGPCKQSSRLQVTTNLAFCFASVRHSPGSGGGGCFFLGSFGMALGASFFCGAVLRG